MSCRSCTGCIYISKIKNSNYFELLQTNPEKRKRKLILTEEELSQLVKQSLSIFIKYKFKKLFKFVR